MLNASSRVDESRHGSRTRYYPKLLSLAPVSNICRLRSGIDNAGRHPESGSVLIAPPVTPLAVCFGEGLVALVPATAVPLEDNRTFHRSLAGAEFNAAVALAAADIRTAVIARVGDDGFGRFLVAELQRHGVDTTAIQSDAVAPTGLYLKELTTRPDGSLDSKMRYCRADSAATGMSPETLTSPAAAALLAEASLVQVSESVESTALDTPVVETIGAGDAFAAGFLAGIVNGLSLAGCLARAHRIASRALVSTRDHID